MSHWLGDVWIWIWDISVVLPLFLYRVENRVCLCHGVQVAGAAWRAAMRIMAGVGDLGQRTVDGRTCRVLGGWAIERLSGAMCGLHRARGDEEWGFLVWATKPRLMVCEWFGLKTGSSGLVVWASKPSGLRFVGCTTKLMERGRCGTRVKIWWLARLEASRARVSRSGLKTGGGVTTGGARGTIVEVALGSRWRRMSWCDGLRWTRLPLLYRFLCIKP
jgi:hypothetical protein